jgi:hypothetical protein
MTCRYIGNRDTDNPIFVLGIPRSGTSLLAGLISLTGIWTGPTNPPSVNNVKGFFENRELKDISTYRVLRDDGWCRRGQHPIPGPDDVLKPTYDVYGGLLRVMYEQGYLDGPWMFKDAKITLMWKIWYEMFPKADYFITKRRDEDIINSCLRTNFMNMQSTASGWQKWIDVHHEHIANFKKTDAKIYEIDTSDLVHGNIGYLAELLYDLGFELPMDKAKEFIVPEAWKGV